MRRYMICFFATALFAIPTFALAQPDVYLSFSNFGENDPFGNYEIAADVGDQLSVYIWVNEQAINAIEMNFHNVLDNSFPYEIVCHEIFNPDIIAFPGEPDELVIGDRWDSIFGGQLGVSEYRAGSLAGGMSQGISPVHNGTGALLDTLYDPNAAAFLYGRIDFVVLHQTKFEIPFTKAIAAETVNGSVSVFDLSTRTVFINSISVPEPALWRRCLPGRCSD